MQISRRAFTGGALGFALGSQLALPRFAQDPDLARCARRDPRLWPKRISQHFRASRPDARR